MPVARVELPHPNNSGFSPAEPLFRLLLHDFHQSAAFLRHSFFMPNRVKGKIHVRIEQSHHLRSGCGYIDQRTGRYCACGTCPDEFAAGLAGGLVGGLIGGPSPRNHVARSTKALFISIRQHRRRRAAYTMSAPITVRLRHRAAITNGAKMTGANPSACGFAPIKGLASRMME